MAFGWRVLPSPRRRSMGRSRWAVVILMAGLMAGALLLRTAGGLGGDQPLHLSHAPPVGMAFDPATEPIEPSSSDGVDSRYAYDPALTPLENHGRDTWYFWTGGGEHFWRKVAIITEGITDLVQFVDSRRRDSRFRTLGVINDPQCTRATRADEYGLWFDECAPQDIPGITGMPTGIVGLRKFPNPKFDKATWSTDRYRTNPRDVEPPYLVGMTCGLCHIGFNPLDPPADPEHPTWRNLAPGIGNQYFDEGKLFSLKMSPDDFRWHVANRQPAGTSDTSRFATDHINNSNAINPIFLLGHRPAHQETMNDGTSRSVHHILKDGADSIGTAGASLRVFVNIGMCSDYWLTLHDPILGMRSQQPFRIERAKKECPEWLPTESRMPAVEAFLKTIGPMRLKDAAGGAQYLSQDSAVLHRGKVVFAERCATCHSSKQPPAELAGDPQQATQWLREAVVKDDFLEMNYLSDDRRYSVLEIGTNMARALASNAVRGHVWEEFSSESYKQMPTVGQAQMLFNPLNPGSPLSFDLGGGGRGYYRTPSLVSIWASAPYFHNNALGIFTKDPSVASRMLAFEDGMRKLLWPLDRLGVQSIPVTTTDSIIRLSNGIEMPVPMGTPINLIARVDPTAVPNLGPRLTGWLRWMVGNRFLLNNLLSYNLAPDFVEDRGHTFGADLSDADKRALIEFVKTF